MASGGGLVEFDVGVLQKISYKQEKLPGMIGGDRTNVCGVGREGRFLFRWFLNRGYNFHAIIREMLLRLGLLTKFAGRPPQFPYSWSSPVVFGPAGGCVCAVFCFFCTCWRALSCSCCCWSSGTSP